MIIQANTCRTCKFSMRMPAGAPPDQEFQCRRFPPIGGPVALPVKPGVIGIQMHAGFVPVGGDTWCGEYKPQISIAANDNKPSEALPAVNDNGPIDLKEYLEKVKRKAS